MLEIARGSLYLAAQSSGNGHGLLCAYAHTRQKVAYEDVGSAYHMEKIGKDIYAFIAPEAKIPIVNGNSVAIVGQTQYWWLIRANFPH